MFFDRHGAPVSLAELTRLFGDPAYRFLARDVVSTPTGAEWEVATAWLGIDQRPGIADEDVDNATAGTGPVLFGTVALDPAGVGDLFEGREWFARTEAEALVNHARLLERLRDGE
jgi:hypothetical protein